MLARAIDSLRSVITPGNQSRDGYSAKREIDIPFNNARNLNSPQSLSLVPRLD